MMANFLKNCRGGVAPIILAKITHDLVRLRADQRGTIAVMIAFLLPVLIGGFGLGFEFSNWYLNTRSMQNAADAAAIAAASNGDSNYDVEAKAVAAQYGFVDGSNNVTVTASNTAACPAAARNASSRSPRSLSRFRRSSTSKRPLCPRMASAPIHRIQWN